MTSIVSRRGAALVALAAVLTAGGNVEIATAAQPSLTLNGLHYELVSARRATSVGSDGETVRAKGALVVLRLRVRNQTRENERAFLLQSYLTGRSGARYRVAHNATDVLSADTPSENTLQEVHPETPIAVVIAFDVAPQDRNLKLHIPAHYPSSGIERVMPLPF